MTIMIHDIKHDSIHSYYKLSYQRAKQQQYTQTGIGRFYFEQDSVFQPQSLAKALVAVVTVGLAYVGPHRNINTENTKIKSLVRNS